eukprot:COSAG04_NODE_2489_length_4023_cov_2.315240_3_plen_279_part_00
MPRSEAELSLLGVEDGDDDGSAAGGPEAGTAAPEAAAIPAAGHDAAAAAIPSANPAAAARCGTWKAALGVLVGVAGIGGTFAFGRYEDSYWHQKDPWRSRREGSGFDVQADGTDKVEEHFGWVRDERNNPLLSPTQASSEPNKKQRVVVLGSGWGARFFLQGIDKDKFEVRVVSPRNFFLFTPLLPSTATGTLPSASVCSPVRELISYKAAPLWRRIYYVWRGELPSETRFYPATCTDVDFAQKVVRCVGDDGEFGMHFDKLVVAIGGSQSGSQSGGE